MRNRRNRVCFIRVSEEEYEALKTAQFREGARTLSEFARMKILEDAGHEVNPASFSERLKAVEQRIERVEADLLLHSQGDAESDANHNVKL